MKQKCFFFFFFLFYFAQTTFASTGATFSLPIVAKDPSGLHGYKGSLWYQPESFIWKHFNIFFDVSASHWWISRQTPNKDINIIAVAPTFRLFFKRGQRFSTFADLSLGLSYLSKTRLDHQNLGIHFAFQDQIGIGAVIGKEQGWMTSISMLHYSNGRLAKHNSGITVPVMLNVGYQF